MSDEFPKKYTVTLKGRTGRYDRLSFSVLNPKEKTADRLIDDLVDKGVAYQETSGNMTWYPPSAIEMVYFDFGK